MAHKDTRIDKVDNIDIVQAEDINNIAKAVIELEESLYIDTETEI